MHPTVAVIFNYNCGSYLIDALDSVLRQDVLPCQVLVIDDGSSDPLTLSILSRLPNSITLIQKPANAGVLDSLRIALEYIFSKYDFPIVSFLDGDDVWLPSKISSVQQVFQSFPTSILVTHGYRVVNANGDPVAGYDDQTIRNHHLLSKISDYSSRSDQVKSDIASFRGVWLGSAFSINCTKAEIEPFLDFIRHSKHLSFSHQDQPLAAYLIACFPGRTFHLIDEVLFLYRQHGLNTSSSSRTLVKALLSIDRSIATLQLCIEIFTSLDCCPIEVAIDHRLLDELLFYKYCYLRNYSKAVFLWFKLSSSLWTYKTTILEVVRFLICLLSPNLFLLIKSFSLTSLNPYNKHTYASF